MTVAAARCRVVCVSYDVIVIGTLFRSTIKTSGIGCVCVAQWLECSINDRKVPGSNPTADTRVFSYVFILPSLDLRPRTTVKLK